MDRPVIIQWTDTAKKQLAALPKKVRRGILDKARALRECGDPRDAHKPLVGSLEGHYRITYGRYRAIYTVREEALAGGGTLSTIRVLFIAVGQRKEHDRKDIYRITQKLLELGIIEPATEESGESEAD